MTSSNEKIAKAFKDMERLYDIPGAKVKPTLKRLLRLYGNHWDFIEENNYEVLLDCIVQDNEQEEDYKPDSGSKDESSLLLEGKKSELAVLSDDEPEDPEPLLKRLLENHNEQPSTSTDKTQRSLIRARDQAEAVLEIKEPAHGHLSQSKRARISYYGTTGDAKGKKPAIAETAGGNRLDIGNGSAIVTQKNTLEMYNKPFQEELPLAVIHPDSTQLELVLADNGEVQISLVYRSSIKLPSRDIIRVLEYKIRKKYGITDPDQLSVKKLMRELCDCFLAMGTNYGNGALALPVFDAECLTSGKDHHESNSNPQLPCCSNVSVDPPLQINVDDCNGKSDQKTYDESEQKMAAVPENRRISDSCSLKDDQKHNSPFNVDKNPIFIEDITRSEERQPISLVNENGALKLPNFVYISQNTAYKNAYVNFSLARISEDNCCSNCYGDCLSSPADCACTVETRGDFAYTPAGLVEEKFLDQCVAMSRRKVSKDRLFYCEICPLENNLGKSSKQQKRKRPVKPCKGHLMRNFIKECWVKCGCNKNCGNRIVQRGITVKLQVFQTPQGKGWGLQTLEELEKGTFVCEYVGEIVTNEELHERNEESAGEEHTYPVLLDADWASERHLKDEEALCLDATRFGNVARFINHRCYDANLVEIPVEVETPDHHYYHLAFFTTRKVEANEELTWDYGIDFEDEDHPIKAFKCKCGSPFCCTKDRA